MQERINELLKVIDDEAAKEDAIKWQKEEHEAAIEALKNDFEVKFAIKQKEYDLKREAVSDAFEMKILKLNEEISAIKVSKKRTKKDKKAWKRLQNRFETT